MRHFRSILYALVLAPAVWVLAGVGFTHDLTTRGRDDFAVESATGLLLLVLAGAAYGILLLAPISPAGPLAGGVVYLGVSLWALVAPSAYAGVWPAELAQEGFDVSRPAYGLAAMLAVPLLCTALSGRRWERYEPVVLPLIGQVGKAAVPPFAAAPTDADPTMAMRLPVVPSDRELPTVGMVTSTAADPDATSVLPSNEPTASGSVVGVPATSSPAATSVAPATDAPAAGAATSSAPESEAPASTAPDSDAPASGAVASTTPDSEAPASDAAASTTPDSDAPASTTPDSDAPSSGAATSTTPDSDAPESLTSGSPALVSSSTASAAPASAPGGSSASTALAIDRSTSDKSEMSLGRADERTTSPSPMSGLAGPMREVAAVAPEDEATIAWPTFRDERRTTVIVSSDEAATVAALCDGQASTKRASVTPPPAEPEVKYLAEAATAITSPADQATNGSARTAAASDGQATSVDADAETAPKDPAAPDGETASKDPAPDGETAPRAAASNDEATSTRAAAANDEAAPDDEAASNDQSDEPTTVLAAAATPSDADEATAGVTSPADEATTDLDATADVAEGEAPDKSGEATTVLATPASETEGAEAPTAADSVPDEEATTAVPADDEDVASLFVTGKAKPAPHSRAVPPDFEETREFGAPDPERTRVINLGELTTKLQVTPTAGESSINEPVKARASVAAPPDASDAEITRSLSAPDPEQTQAIKVVAPEREPGTETTHSITVITSEDAPTASGLDDGETTRSLSAPDPDRTQTIAVLAESTRSLELTTVGREVDEVTQALNGPDPERTQSLGGAELRLMPPVAPAGIARHPGLVEEARAAQPGPADGDETQVIRLDPDRTQIIRPGSVEPPGERTELIRLPAAGAEDARGPVSIADAERPNFAEDPTSRIVPPDGNEGDGEKREMTVMNMERPPEDEPGIPRQRTSGTAEG